MVDGSWKLPYQQSAMADGFMVIVVLEADEAVRGARFGVCPPGHHFIVDAHGVILPVANDLERVPLAQWFGVGFGGCCERVDRPGAPRGVFRSRIANLH